MSGSRERLEQCFRTVFPGLRQEEIARASQASVPKWDSLASVTLAALIEEEFGVRIGEDEFDDMVSFAQALELVDRKIRHGA